jgi:hypothetical protein
VFSAGGGGCFLNALVAGMNPYSRTVESFERV